MTPAETTEILLIGNPENRRVRLFQEALASLHRPPARVFAWIDLARDLGKLAALPDAPLFVRIDSPGENDDVDRAFLVRGWAAAKAAGVETIAPDALAALPASKGRILCPRQHHLGFLETLADLERVFAAHPSWRILNAPGAIADLFDKRITSRMYAEHGIPVPRPFEGIDSFESLRQAMKAREVSTVYVKLSSGSSASCLVVFHELKATAYAMTTIEQAKDGWFNSLRVRRVDDLLRIESLVAYLIAEGAQIEESVPKARLDRRFFDLRMLAIAGEVEFIVVRQSTHPITNLHLGGRRGDLSRLFEAAPKEAIESAKESVRRVARLHDCLHVGVDLLFLPSYVGHRVVEANAFGDLLPNLSNDGRSVYAVEIEAMGGWREGTRSSTPSP
jgi:hypothetical protein